MQDTQQPGSFAGGDSKNGGHFNGHEGSPISLENASAKTAAFRNKYPGEIKANFYGRDIIERILHEPGCVGIRIYNAINPLTGNLDVVLVGADADQNDILTIIGKKGGDRKGCNVFSAIIALPASPQATPATIAGNPEPCPQCCASNSPLT
ncbi:MAG TPA: hypothetical protein VIU45_00140 [Chitinophagaceae bacterium]